MQPSFQSASMHNPIAGALTVDAVNAFMWRVYRWMSLGLAATGLVAMLIADSPQALSVIFGNSLLFGGLVVGELGLVIAFTAVARRVSAGAAAAMFFSYAALNGVTLAAIFLAYTHESIAQAFFITAGTFAVLSVFGATTKRDLSAMGRFMFVGLIGLVIATLVNIFWNNSALYWVTTYAGVLIFAGLTAYDTQKLRQMFVLGGGDQENLSLQGALIFYLDFINLFLLLLRLFGRRR
jgi:FtsH-binding integral membrane protein